MKRRNFLWNLLAIMMVAMLSMTFVSCSDDDDDKTATSPIVGIWEWEDDESDDYDIITFRADGTGTWSQYYDDETEIETFSYQYDPKTNILLMHVGDEVEKSIVTIIGDIMYWDGYTYRRVK